MRCKVTSSKDGWKVELSKEGLEHLANINVITSDCGQFVVFYAENCKYNIVKIGNETIANEEDIESQISEYWK